MPKDPLKNLKKKINSATKTVKNGITQAQTTIAVPIRQEANKLISQSAPIIAQANRKVNEAIIKPIEQQITQVVNQVAQEATPIIAQSSQKITKAAKAITKTIEKNDTRISEPTKVKPKKSAGTKLKLPLIKKQITKKTIANITSKEKLSNVAPVLPNIKTPELPETEKISNTTLGVSNTTLGVMVTGGIALGLVGALFGEFSSGAGFIIQMASGAISGAITGSAAAIVTEVIGGSPKVVQAVDNVKKTSITYVKTILKSKAVQKAKITLIKAGLRIAKNELNNPRTHKAIKDEIKKEVNKAVKTKIDKLEKQLYKEPTDQIKATAKKIGRLFSAKPSSTKYKKPTTKRNEQHSR